MYDDQGRHKRRGSADAIFPGFGRGVLEEAGPGPRTLTEKFPVRVYLHNGRRAVSMRFSQTYRVSNVRCKSAPLFLYNHLI